MTQFKNMKFKVDSPEQSERLQKVLFGLGYQWAGSRSRVEHTGKRHIYADDDSHLGYSRGSDESFYNSQKNEEMNTTAFLAAHEPAPTQEPIKHPEFPWFYNTGTMPDLSAGTKVDIVFRGSLQEQFSTTSEPDRYYWHLGLSSSDIVKWRYHRSEKPEEYYVQPKTEPKLDAQGNKRLDCATYDNEGNMLSLKVNSLSSINANDIGRIVTGTIDTPKDLKIDWLGNVEKPTIDSHYNFSYTLTEDDRLAGTIKIDPYFVAQQWKLGSKDDSGVIWHIFKTCARFGMKNDKAREITAIYKSIQRLAQLEGVEL